MTNSPARDIENPLVGKAGAGEGGAPPQQTDEQQRPGASNSESKGKEAPGTTGGPSGAAISGAADAASKLGEAGGSRKEVETGSAPQ